MATGPKAGPECSKWFLFATDSSSRIFELFVSVFQYLYLVRRSWSIINLYLLNLRDNPITLNIYINYEV